MVQFRKLAFLVALLVVLCASSTDALLFRRRRTTHSAATSAVKWSRHANLANALPLSGARITGRVYIFVTANASTTRRKRSLLLFRRRRRRVTTTQVGIKVVQFWLDRAPTGTPDRTDASSPFLLGKGAQGAFAANRLSTGNHVIHVKSIGTNGAASAPFSCKFQVAMPPAGPVRHPARRSRHRSQSGRSCRDRFGAHNLKKRCSNGRYVYRKLSNNCNFDSCPRDNDYSHRECNPNSKDYNPRAPQCRSAGGRDRACKTDLFRCPTLKYVRRNRNLDCRFNACPRTPAPQRCSAESRRCPSGVSVYRDPYRSCAFPACTRHGVKNAGHQGGGQGPVIRSDCTSDLRKCSNGLAIARAPELDCAFPACPTGSTVTQVANPCVARYPTAMTHKCPSGAIVTRVPELSCRFPLCSTVSTTGFPAANQPLTGNTLVQARSGVAPAASIPAGCGSANDGSCTGGGCPGGSTCCKNICYAAEEKDDKFPVVWIIVIAAVVLFGVVGAVAVCGKSGSTVQQGPMGGYVGGMEYHRNPVNL